MPICFESYYSFSEIYNFSKSSYSGKDFIETIRLSRLNSSLFSSEGSILCEFYFSLIYKYHCSVTFKISGKVQLLCQRCLEPFFHYINENAQYILLESDQAGLVESDGKDILIVSEEGLNIAVLIEDELILSLPIIASHKKNIECGSLADKISKY